jgi:hypothetical protein
MAGPAPAKVRFYYTPTDFLVARTGGDFKVPIKQAALAGPVNPFGDGQTENTNPAKERGQPFRITPSQLREVVANIGLPALGIKLCPQLPFAERHTEKIEKEACKSAQMGDYIFDATGNSSRNSCTLVCSESKPRARRGFPFLVMG